MMRLNLRYYCAEMTHGFLKESFFFLFASEKDDDDEQFNKITIHVKCLYCDIDGKLLHTLAVLHNRANNHIPQTLSCHFKHFFFVNVK